ncbi:MAG TPA: SH3 domain-containing protein [Spirillospora sp.]
MRKGVKIGIGFAAASLAAGALSGGAVAAASQPPPIPGVQQLGDADPRPWEEEGHGPGAIYVGPKGAAKAMGRLHQRDHQRARWCNGKVLPLNGLNVRSGPGTGYRIIGALPRGRHVTTDWDSIERRDGYLWVKLSGDRGWIADYKIGNGNGKWYVGYSNC